MVGGSPGATALAIILLLAAFVNAGPINRKWQKRSVGDFNLTDNIFSQGVGGECVTEHGVYHGGESVPSPGPCETCTCRPPSVFCQMVRCPINPGCRTIQRANQCCPDYRCECEHDGKTYNNGEKIVIPEQPCQVCYCKGGEVMCTSITCYQRDDCEPRYIPGQCCPKYDHCPPLDSNDKKSDSGGASVKTSRSSNSGYKREMQPWLLTQSASKDHENEHTRAYHPSTTQQDTQTPPDDTQVDRKQPNTVIFTEMTAEEVKTKLKSDADAYENDRKVANGGDGGKSGGDGKDEGKGEDKVEEVGKSSDGDEKSNESVETGGKGDEKEHGSNVDKQVKDESIIGSEKDRRVDETTISGDDKTNTKIENILGNTESTTDGYAETYMTTNDQKESTTDFSTYNPEIISDKTIIDESINPMEMEDNFILNDVSTLYNIVPQDNTESTLESRGFTTVESEDGTTSSPDLKEFISTGVTDEGGTNQYGDYVRDGEVYSVSGLEEEVSTESPLRDEMNNVEKSGVVTTEGIPTTVYPSTTTESVLESTVGVEHEERFEKPVEDGKTLEKQEVETKSSTEETLDREVTSFVTEIDDDDREEKTKRTLLPERLDRKYTTAIHPSQVAHYDEKTKLDDFRLHNENMDKNRNNDVTETKYGIIKSVFISNKDDSLTGDVNGNYDMMGTTGVSTLDIEQNDEERSSTEKMSTKDEMDDGKVSVESLEDAETKQGTKENLIKKCDPKKKQSKAMVSASKKNEIGVGEKKMKKAVEEGKGVKGEKGIEVEDMIKEELVDDEKGMNVGKNNSSEKSEDSSSSSSSSSSDDSKSKSGDKDDDSSDSSSSSSSSSSESKEDKSKNKKSKESESSSSSSSESDDSKSKSKSDSSDSSSSESDDSKSKHKSKDDSSDSSSSSSSSSESDDSKSKHKSDSSDSSSSSSSSESDDSKSKSKSKDDSSDSSSSSSSSSESDNSKSKHKSKDDSSDSSSSSSSSESDESKSKHKSKSDSSDSSSSSSSSESDDTKSKSKSKDESSDSSSSSSSSESDDSKSKHKSDSSDSSSSSSSSESDDSKSKSKSKDKSSDSSSSSSSSESDDSKSKHKSDSSDSSSSSSSSSESDDSKSKHKSDSSDSSSSSSSSESDDSKSKSRSKDDSSDSSSSESDDSKSKSKSKDDSSDSSSSSSSSSESDDSKSKHKSDSSDSSSSSSSSESDDSKSKSKYKDDSSDSSSSSSSSSESDDSKSKDKSKSDSSDSSSSSSSSKSDESKSKKDSDSSSSSKDKSKSESSSSSSSSSDSSDSSKSNDSKSKSDSSSSSSSSSSDSSESKEVLKNPDSSEESSSSSSESDESREEKSGRKPKSDSSDSSDSKSKSKSDSSDSSSSSSSSESDDSKSKKSKSDSSSSSSSSSSESNDKKFKNKSDSDSSSSSSSSESSESKSKSDSSSSSSSSESDDSKSKMKSDSSDSSSSSSSSESKSKDKSKSDSSDSSSSSESSSSSSESDDSKSKDKTKSDSSDSSSSSSSSSESKSKDKSKSDSSDSSSSSSSSESTEEKTGEKSHELKSTDNKSKNESSSESSSSSSSSSESDDKSKAEDASIESSTASSIIAPGSKHDATHETKTDDKIEVTNQKAKPNNAHVGGKRKYKMASNLIKEKDGQDQLNDDDVIVLDITNNNKDEDNLKTGEPTTFHLDLFNLNDEEDDVEDGDASKTRKGSSKQSQRPMIKVMVQNRKNLNISNSQIILTPADLKLLAEYLINEKIKPANQNHDYDDKDSSKTNSIITKSLINNGDLTMVLNITTMSDIGVGKEFTTEVNTVTEGLVGNEVETFKPSDLMKDDKNSDRLIEKGEDVEDCGEETTTSGSTLSGDQRNAALGEETKDVTNTEEPCDEETDTQTEAITTDLLPESTEYPDVHTTLSDDQILKGLIDLMRKTTELKDEESTTIYTRTNNGETSTESVDSTTKRKLTGDKNESNDESFSRKVDNEAGKESYTATLDDKDLHLLKDFMRKHLNIK